MFQHYGYSAMIVLSAIHFAVSFYLNRRAAAYTDDLYDQEKPDWVTPPNTGEDGKMLRTIGAFLSYIPSCFLWHLIQQYTAMYVTEHVGMYQFTDSLVTIIGFEFFFIASLRLACALLPYSRLQKFIPLIYAGIFNSGKSTLPYR